MVSRVKSFHYNAGDADPVSGESTTPTQQTLLRHRSPPSCLNFSSDADISCNSCISVLNHGISHHRMPPTTTTTIFFFNPCSVSSEIHSPEACIVTDLYRLKKCWMQNASADPKKIHMLKHRFMFPPFLHRPFFHTHTYICAPHFSPSHSFSLSFQRAVFPFLPTLENEWAGKWLPYCAHPGAVACVWLPIGVVNELVMGQEGHAARVVEAGTGQTSWARWIKHQLEKPFYTSDMF